MSPTSLKLMLTTILSLTAIMETEVEFLSVDKKKMVAKYLAVNLTEDEQRKQYIISSIPDRVTELEGFGRERVSMAYLDKDYIKRKDYNGVMEKVEKWKDHKDFILYPPTRPVCCANVGTLLEKAKGSPVLFREGRCWLRC